MNMQIKIHNVHVVLYRPTLWYSYVLIRWYTRRFCMFVISPDCDGAQYDVVSLAVCLCVSLSVWVCGVYVQLYTTTIVQRYVVHDFSCTLWNTT